MSEYRTLLAQKYDNPDVILPSILIQNTLERRLGDNDLGIIVDSDAVARGCDEINIEAPSIVYLVAAPKHAETQVPQLHAPNFSEGSNNDFRISVNPTLNPNVNLYERATSLNVAFWAGLLASDSVVETNKTLLQQRARWDMRRIVTTFLGGEVVSETARQVNNHSTGSLEVDVAILGLQIAGYIAFILKNRQLTTENFGPYVAKRYKHQAEGMAKKYTGLRYDVLTPSELL